jgi:hypothetical protein
MFMVNLLLWGRVVLQTSTYKIHFACGDSETIPLQMCTHPSKGFPTHVQNCRRNLSQKLFKIYHKTFCSSSRRS